MNTLLRHLVAGVLLSAPGPLAVAQLDAAPSPLQSRFETTTLILGYDESLTTSNGRDDLAEFLEAIGPVTYVANPHVAPGSGGGSLTWPESRTLSDVFRAIQNYRFPSDSDITLSNVGLSWKYWAPEVDVITSRRVFNLSARADVGAGERVTIGGLIIPGDSPRLVAFKVRGASLSAFGINAPLTDPKLELFQGSHPILSNDDHTSLRPWERWFATDVCEPLADPKESMLVTFLEPGAYTAIVSGADGGSGIALLEMYLVDEFVIER